VASNRSRQSTLTSRIDALNTYSKMALFVCDTDFLIKAANDPLPALANFLTESGYELKTLDRIEKELEGLSKSKNPSTAKRAKTALRAIAAGQVKVISQKDLFSNRTDADSQLIEFAANSKKNVAIATLDHTLLSMLERKKLPYLTLRNDKPLFRTF
jgi:rRNA-processing protein FCF1